MKALQIKKDLYWTGVLDPELRVFDIIMETKYGTSYNSYLLTGSEKTALFETAKLAFFDEMVSYIESVVSVSQIDYLIMDHTEPDHAGSIEKLLELNPHITIVATGTAIQFLKHIINTDFNSIAVHDGSTLSLGDKTLEFMVLPNLHWPDTMYTYVQEIKTLFPCDSFGSHYAAEGVLRSSVSDEAGYAEATKYYFDCIIGPFAYPYMYNALERIKDLEIENICCGHGPVLDSHFDQLFGWYREWCKPPVKKEKKLVVMPYVSAYGYTKQLSEEIAKGVSDAGAEVHRYDLVFDDKTNLAADMAAADGYLFGTPTILGEALEPVYNLTLGMYPPGPERAYRISLRDSSRSVSVFWTASGSVLSRMPISWQMPMISVITSDVSFSKRNRKSRLRRAPEHLSSALYAERSSTPPSRNVRSAA